MPILQSLNERLIDNIFITKILNLPNDIIQFL